MAEANKKLFTIQQEPKENYPSSENTEIRPSFLGDSYAGKPPRGDIMNLSENGNRIDTDTMLNNDAGAAQEYNPRKYRPGNFIRELLLTFYSEF